MRRAACRLAAALVVLTLLRPAGASGLILLHDHCDDDLHVHVSGHDDPHSWQAEHARHDSCEGHDDAHESAHVDAAGVCCSHDAPIVILVAIDLNAPTRTATVQALPLNLLATAGVHPRLALPTGMTQLARSTGRWRADVGTRVGVAAVLLRNHALLL